MPPPSLQYHRNKQMARINQWCLDQTFPYTDSELLNHTGGSGSAMPGVKHLKYSAPVFLSYGFSPHTFTRLLIKFWESQELTQDLYVCIILFRLSAPNINSLLLAQAGTHQWDLKHHWFCIHTATHFVWCLLDNHQELVQETEHAPGTGIFIYLVTSYLELALRQTMNWL